MKPSMILLPVVAALALALAPPVLAQQGHADHDVHAAHDAAAPVAIPAQRYAPDAALREGMSRIHAALDELRHYEMGHMPQSIAVERVASIKEATDYLFANCKLDAQADAALHGMLVPLLSGVQAFNKNPADSSTVSVMRDAVSDYPSVFDDPNWLKSTTSGTEPAH